MLKPYWVAGNRVMDTMPVMSLESRRCMAYAIEALRAAEYRGHSHECDGYDVACGTAKGRAAVAEIFGRVQQGTGCTPCGVAMEGLGCLSLEALQYLVSLSSWIVAEEGKRQAGWDALRVAGVRDCEGSCHWAKEVRMRAEYERTKAG